GVENARERGDQARVPFAERVGFKGHLGRPRSDLALDVCRRRDLTAKLPVACEAHVEAAISRVRERDVRDLPALRRRSHPLLHKVLTLVVESRTSADTRDASPPTRRGQ